MESRWVGRNQVVGNYRCPEWYGIVADSTQGTVQKFQEIKAGGREYRQEANQMKSEEAKVGDARALLIACVCVCLCRPVKFSQSPVD